MTDAPVFHPDEHTFFYSWEIKKHLELRPFLQIPLAFDHKACFDEAMNVMNFFVDHRNYAPELESGPRWKSVCLRGIDGKTDKTLYHADYGVRQNPNYQMTEAARLCPKTMEFLKSITDLERCERIRFMLLEPGAKIHVHTDAPNDRSVVAFNIALNMPRGCEFHINTLPDGTHSPWTEKIPFEDGTGFLINVANYHYVENKSNEARIHIILHGPLKMTESRLLQWARRQNRVENEKQLVSRLTLRYAEQNVPFKNDVVAEWVKFAVETDEILRHIRLIVLNPDSYSPEMMDENTHRITAASLYPLSAEYVSESELDSFLKKMDPDDNRMAVILGAGVYIEQFYEFFYEVFALVGDMKRKNTPVAGHILHFSGELPTLHEQFLVLNTPMWREAGEPAFGDLYEPRAMEFAPFIRDDENVHDDYTPKALYPSSGVPAANGRGRFGTPLLSRFLELGWTIRNVPMELRALKKYSYFKKPKSRELEDIRQSIKNKFSNEAKHVYCFNNEPVTIVDIPDFQPRVLLSVASGFKPASLAHRFGATNAPLRCAFYDINADALKYQQALSRVSDRKSLRKVIESFSFNAALKNNVDEYLNLVLKNGFENDEDALWSTLKTFSAASFNALDFVSDPLALLKDVPADEKCVFWHSNAWANNFVYYLMSREQIEDRYTQLINAIRTKLGTKAWRHAYHREILFGDSLSDVRMIMTDGVMQGPLNPGLYSQID